MFCSEDGSPIMAYDYTQLYGTVQKKKRKNPVETDGLFLQTLAATLIKQLGWDISLSEIKEKICREFRDNQEFYSENYPGITENMVDTYLDKGEGQPDVQDLLIPITANAFSINLFVDRRSENEPPVFKHPDRRQGNPSSTNTISLFKSADRYDVGLLSNTRLSHQNTEETVEGTRQAR